MILRWFAGHFRHIECVYSLGYIVGSVRYGRQSPPGRSVGRGRGLLGDRASGVTPLPPVRAGRPSAAQAHRVRHRRLELRLLLRRRLAPREDLRALHRLRTGASPALFTDRLTVKFFNSAVRSP